MPVLDVVVPDSLGAIDECVVVTWLKREGDPVAADEISEDGGMTFRR